MFEEAVPIMHLDRAGQTIPFHLNIANAQQSSLQEAKLLAACGAPLCHLSNNHLMLHFQGASIS